MNQALLDGCSVLLGAIKSALDCEAIIVGGMLRDMDNGVPIKDIDVFCVRHDATWTLDDLAVRLRSIDGLEVTTQLQMTYCANKEVNLCLTCRVPGIPQEIQVIMCNFDKLEEARDRVDFGLCQISFDGKLVSKTDQYLKDQADKMFRLVRCTSETDRERSMKRLKRFLTKYPGWGFEDLTV